ncbi:hypothetical protein I7I51_02200 [Histoplasma capsulatum]|uniref:Uncharacterized protein n=1 Tax=Ajellomyces capsulatus TaxID=5037 RepID=A0A8A1MCL4_AJECA|nr:predicted protein [Histoplasma mississippiense (nom. inval.)]EDN09781.1 predicted protein [Histoplasma mississippiense (nom. inval.)]QSS62463.1 hypothetical protein I7I51_02200 [Histoplasma capsulatum]
MNRVAARGFHATAQRVLQYSGSVNLGDVISTNADGTEWGARAHRSSKDRNDSKDVITVALLTATGTRVGSAHFHLDGSFKFFPSRAGKLGGFADNLQKAGLVVEEGGPEGNTRSAEGGSLARPTLIKAEEYERISLPKDINGDKL